MTTAGGSSAPVDIVNETGERRISFVGQGFRATFGEKKLEALAEEGDTDTRSSKAYVAIVRLLRPRNELTHGTASTFTPDHLGHLYEVDLRNIHEVLVTLSNRRYEETHPPVTASTVAAL